MKHWDSFGTSLLLFVTVDFLHFSGAFGLKYSTDQYHIPIIEDSYRTFYESDCPLYVQIEPRQKLICWNMFSQQSITFRYAVVKCIICFVTFTFKSMTSTFSNQVYAIGDTKSRLICYILNFQSISCSLNCP